ncbi:LysR family transcriptional regulator [Yinghuangia sp. ASG 101]|uniref:LysR family transcriptional regulator n=1 Tax=Yinghuangia sp. ASG 101 TaxID=2896848 RepID=UPI001E59F4C1|nr:LysR family transcriptional regulator [Yinghuangia sp. ASG 101]UGQ11411.1 LysR family transcriptional regulator [Yinghuangia sp. ASG 101]
MDFKQLTALITVAEAGSVTRAAELLDLVQPAVTQRIISLEKELGIPLFERTQQGMRPTEAGTIMVDHARRALDELKRARVRLQPTGVLTGTVTVGLLESTGDALGRPFLSLVAREQPHINLRVITGHSRQLQRGLDEGDLDVSLLGGPHRATLLSAAPLVSDRLWVVAPRSDDLRPDEPVPFAAAVERPLVLPPRDHALRTLIDMTADDAGAALTIAAEANSVRMLKQFVLAGHGWTILPGVAIADDLAAGVVHAAPVCQPDLERTVILGTPRGRNASPAVQMVGRLLTRGIKSVVAQGGWHPNV